MWILLTRPKIKYQLPNTRQIISVPYTWSGQVIRFSHINRLNSVDHKPNYQRHHLIPLQAVSESDLLSLFEIAANDGFDLDDFELNGILLPSCEKEALRTGQPLHRGPHPLYNEIVMKRLLRISKLSDRLDGFVQRQDFIRFRLSLLQSSLRSGLNKRSFSKIYLSARDPLRSRAKFDLMDSRIEQIACASGLRISDRACFTFSSKSLRKSYFSEL